MLTLTGALWESQTGGEAKRENLYVDNLIDWDINSYFKQKSYVGYGPKSPFRQPIKLKE